jgi:shikimate dehydrogenase
MGLTVRGLTMVVVGSGGAARALAHAVAGGGASVIVSSRSERPGRALARKVRGRWVPLGRLPRESYDVLINCTPAGMTGNGRPDGGPLPVPLRAIKGRLVYDVVYTPASTALLRAADRRKIQTLGGLEMLVLQAAEQYQLFSGRSAPIDMMREAARQELIDQRGAG